MFMRNFIFTTLGPCLLLLSLQALAQGLNESGVYKSEVDQLFTIQKVSVLPFSDNAQGIYSRPLEAYLSAKLDQMHMWDFVAANSIGPILSPEELEEDSKKVQQVTQGLDADAFFVARVTKGPGGMTLKLNMFLKKDARLIAQASTKEFSKFSLDELKSQMDSLLTQITRALPFSGRVLSRQGQRVTLNIGRLDGIQEAQIVTAVQVIQVQRHPKFHFLVSSEKEILGRIKILKVDETLSFGAVLTEKERGAVERNTKIGPIDFVSYGNVSSLDGTAEPDLLGQRSDGEVAFGNNPKPWVPTKAPSFGQVGARFGLGSFNQSTKLSAAGTLDSSTQFAPNVFVEGELWITQRFTVRAGLRQGILTVKNPTGGSPTDLAFNLSSYELLFGYHFRFGATVWDPNAEVFAGYLNHKLFVDASTPEAFTTSEYGGIKLGLRGALPVSEDKLWSVGGQFSLVLSPRLNESPITSGSSSSNSVNQFGMFLTKKLKENLKAQANLDFELFSSNFSGAGTRSDSALSMSQRHTTLSGGLYYLF